MVLHRTTRWLVLTVGLALALPAAAAQASSAGPVAHAAGGDAPLPNPSVVGVPIQRTDEALSSAADAIDAGNGAQAAGPLTASRRYLLRSYSGAKYLIAHPPPAPADDAGASAKKFRSMARSFVRAHRRGDQRRWIKAHASDDAAGPAFADGVTAVFNVLTSQYSAATAAVGMAPDTKGQLLAKVKTTLNTAIVLRNRLVKVIHAAAPAPADDASVRAHASQEEGAPTFDVVMPGLTVLLDDELQQMQAAVADNSVPSDAKAILTSAIAADKQIETLVNTYWPPVAADD
jgi:HAMP domain-containing protein